LAFGTYLVKRWSADFIEVITNAQSIPCEKNWPPSPTWTMQAVPALSVEEDVRPSSANIRLQTTARGQFQ
jgi:hypothetical protein